MRVKYLGNYDIDSDGYFYNRVRKRKLKANNCNDVHLMIDKKRTPVKVPIAIYEMFTGDKVGINETVRTLDGSNDFNVDNLYKDTFRSKKCRGFTESGTFDMVFDTYSLACEYLKKTFGINLQPCQIGRVITGSYQSAGTIENAEGEKERIIWQCIMK